MLRSSRAAILRAAVVVASLFVSPLVLAGGPPSTPPVPALRAPRVVRPQPVAPAASARPSRPKALAPARSTASKSAAEQRDTAARPRVPVRLRKVPDLIVYDWDGTLGDTYPQLRFAVDRAARDVGIVPKAARGVDPYRTVIDGSDLETMFWRLAPGGTHAGEQAFVSRFRAHIANAPPELSPMKPGVREELAALRAKHPGVKLALLSSRPQDTLEGLVKQAGVDHLFSAVVGTGASIIPAKPAPDGLLLITRRLGIDPKASVMVGDTPMDVDAGKAAGMVTVALRDGMGAHHALDASKPDVVLDTLTGFVDRVLPPSRRPSPPILHALSAASL